MRNLSKTIVAAVTGLAVMGLGVAHADVKSDGSENTTYTFSGTNVKLTKGVTLSCNFSVDGEFSGLGTNSVVVTVTDADATAGSLLCGTVGFGFNWTSEAMADSSLGSSATDTRRVVGDFYNVQVTSFLGNCSGTVEDVVFSNAVNSTDTRSFFYFNSEVGNDGCFVEGTVYANAVDVNVWD